MKYFFLVEIIPLVIDVSWYTIAILDYNTDLIPKSLYKAAFEIDSMVQFIYPFLQAYGIIKLKDSKDPINGISNLN